MKRIALVLLLLTLCLAPLHAAQTITSFLGHKGPALKPGSTPKTLGWGPNNKPYPDKFTVHPGDLSEMVWVPAGKFLMGSSSKEQAYALAWAKRASKDAKASDYAPEGPQHEVHITKGFWMGKYPVTNAQFRRFGSDHECGTRDGLSLNGDNQPVVLVTWEQADTYCETYHVQLPTEAQWEYACRAGTKTKFWWGDSEQDAGKYANVADLTAKKKWPNWTVFDTDDGYAVSSPVGSFKPNAFGLCDMLGNVCQWCRDFFGTDYYAKSRKSNPKGPKEGYGKVLRGGSWDENPWDCRSGARSGSSGHMAAENWGFRVMAPVQ